MKHYFLLDVRIAFGYLLYINKIVYSTGHEVWRPQSSIFRERYRLLH